MYTQPPMFICALHGVWKDPPGAGAQSLCSLESALASTVSILSITGLSRSVPYFYTVLSSYTSPDRHYSPFRNPLALRAAGLHRRTILWALRPTTSFTLTLIMHVLLCHYVLLHQLHLTTTQPIPTEKLHQITHRKAVETNALQEHSHLHTIAVLRHHPHRSEPAPRPFHIMPRSRHPLCSIRFQLLLLACLDCPRSPRHDGRVRACRHHPGSPSLTLIPVS